jgi:hypothetical protein
LLSEAARQKRADESIEACLIRGGLDAGYSKIEEWLGEARSFARRLNSELLDSYMDYRSDQLAEFWRSLRPNLVPLRHLADVLEGRPNGIG